MTDRRDEQGPRVPDVAGDVQAVRAALNGHFQRGRGGCPKCHKGHDALDRLAALIEQLQRERYEQATLAETRRISRSQYRARAERAEAALQRLIDSAHERANLSDMALRSDNKAVRREANRIRVAFVDEIEAARAALVEAGRVPEPAAPSEPEVHHTVSDPAPTDGRLTDAGSGSLGAEGAPPPEGTAP